MFHSIEKWTLGLVPIFGGRAIKWGLIIAYLGYLVQSVQGKVNTVEHMDYGLYIIGGLQTYQRYVVYVNVRHDIELCSIRSHHLRNNFFLFFA